jgi:hypothetical protein
VHPVLGGIGTCSILIRFKTFASLTITPSRPFLASATFISALTLMLAAVFVVNFFAAKRNNTEELKQRADAVLLRDAIRVIETWKPLADGMELTLRPKDASDEAGFDDSAYDPTLPMVRVRRILGGATVAV